MSTPPPTYPQPTLPPAPPITYTLSPSAPHSVVITDINMSIGAMCRFMVKWAIAAIPALFILWVLLVSVVLLLALAFGGIFHSVIGPLPGRF